MRLRFDFRALPPEPQKFVDCLPCVLETRSQARSLERSRKALDAREPNYTALSYETAGGWAERLAALAEPGRSVYTLSTQLSTGVTDAFRRGWVVDPAPLLAVAQLKRLTLALASQFWDSVLIAFQPAGPHEIHAMSMRLSPEAMARVFGHPGEELLGAVEEHDLAAVGNCLARGADPNYSRPSSDDQQPNSPLKMVAFRISDNLLGDDDLAQFAEIAALLLRHGADPLPARELAERRYGRWKPGLPETPFLKAWGLIAK
jgi:hypothetical protein